MSRRTRTPDLDSDTPAPRPLSPEWHRYRIFDARGRHLRDASGPTDERALHAATRSALHSFQPWPAAGEPVRVARAASRGWKTLGPGRVLVVPEIKVLRAAK